ncbi:MAG TPA: hypothetical protein VIW29_02940, partial [Polyangiaceae bacterium]
SAVAVASAVTSASAVVTPYPPPAATPACRALRVTGEAKLGDAPLASGALLDGGDWITLAPGGAVALKHTQSGRELIVSGPAMFRACRRGREQLLLTSGTVTVGAGMGSRPGAEVLMAMPVGSLRYADAEFTLVLDAKKLSVAVRAGQVEMDAALPSKPLKSPLRARDKLQVAVGKQELESLLRRCQELAEAAATSARLVADRGASESLGERARANVAARKAARSACTIAASATGLVADPTARAAYWAEAERWEGLWESIPSRRPSQAPEK